MYYLRKSVYNNWDVIDCEFRFSIYKPYRVTIDYYVVGDGAPKRVITEFKNTFGDLNVLKHTMNAYTNIYYFI
jgi:hypothetical protein